MDSRDQHRLCEAFGFEKRAAFSNHTRLAAGGDRELDFTRLPMTDQQRALWKKIEAFPFDGYGVVLDFTARLARENGWSRGFAAEVVEEYKRFLFLAMVAGHPVTPSEQVDQAWHLHLVYTKSYWEELCGKVLGRPLHHGPTEGGMAEGHRFRCQYEETLASYERLFGGPAPSAIWPPVEKRFGSVAARWVDPAASWVIPKPGWWPRGRLFPRWQPRVVLRGAVIFFSVSLLAGCADHWNVLDWQGHEFLTFYLGMLLAALVASLLLVGFAKGKAESNTTLPEDPYHIAFWAGGGGRAFDTAMAALYGAGKITLASRQEIQRSLGANGDDLCEFESRVLKAVPHQSSAPAKSILQSLQPAIDELRQQVEARGWVWSSSRRRRLQSLAAFPFLLLMGIGAAKVMVGLGRDKPVFFLVMLLILTLVVLLYRVHGVARRTPAGQAVWKRLRENFPLPGRGSQLPAGMSEGNAHLTNLVAVHGLAAAALLGMPDLRPALMTGRMDSANSGSGGCGSGGGCSSSSGGGDSGCGGGGCGGCGGGAD